MKPPESPSVSLTEEVKQPALYNAATFEKEACAEEFVGAGDTTREHYTFFRKTAIALKPAWMLGSSGSGRLDSNQRHSRWQRDALPTELRPRFRERETRGSARRRARAFF